MPRFSAFCTFDMYCNTFADFVDKKCNLWYDKYRFTKQHKAAMREVFKTATGKPKRQFSKHTVAIIIAAVILSLTVTAFALPQTREYIVRKFSDHFSYSVPHSRVENVDKEPSLGFIPDSFTPAETRADKCSYSCMYENQSGKYFYVDKNTINVAISYDTEKYDDKIIEYDSVSYIVYRTEYTYGVIWNDGNYVYQVCGNLSENEIFNIAICTKRIRKICAKRRNENFSAFLSQNDAF